MGKFDAKSRGVRGAATIHDWMHLKGRTIAGALVWSEWELDAVRKHFPDMETLCRLLNLRTPGAIRAKAKQLGLVEPRHLWSEKEKAVYPKPYRRGDPLEEIQLLLDNRTKKQIYGRASHDKARRPRRPPTPTGIRIIDQIRMRAFDCNMTMKELDAEVGRRRYFSVKPKHFDWWAIARALKILGGRLIAVWGDGYEMR